MKTNININKISFGDNSLFQRNNITDSYNFKEDDIANINDNENINMNNPMDEFQKKLYEYEQNNTKNKKEKKHFDFKGGFLDEINKGINANSNNNNNIDNNKDKHNTLGGDNNINNPNNNKMNNIVNNDSEFNIENYDEDFLSNVVIDKNCRLFSKSKYIVFQNKYGENSCYINCLLHFLYNSKDICSYLRNLYISNKSNKENGNNNRNNNEEKNIDEITKDNNTISNKEEDKKKKIEFLTLLGKILYQYNMVLEKSSHQIVKLNTFEFREYLNIFSKGKFPLNYVADPIDFLNFIFEILNEFIKEEMKNNFFLQLNEQFTCSPKCNIYKSTKYDNDNFIYTIYIEEVINYLIKFNINEKNYNNKFFQFCQLTNLQDSIKCSKCKNDMWKKLCCGTYPNYLIINCAWNQPKPEIDKVIKFFVLLSLKDDLKYLFQTKTKKNSHLTYNLTHIILYSSNLSHYITILYNPRQKLFCLYDDSCIIEFYKLIEVIEAITINLLMNNENNYYYPVLLIYSKLENYDENTLKNNKLNEESYIYLINKCNLAIKHYRINYTLTEKEKYENYQRMVQKQKQISLANQNNGNINNNNSNLNKNIDNYHKNNNNINDFNSFNHYNEIDKFNNNIGNNHHNNNNNINQNINHKNNNINSNYQIWSMNKDDNMNNTINNTNNNINNNMNNNMNNKDNKRNLII